MVYNEKLKREIPEGWEVESYSNLFEIKLGGTPSTTNDEYWGGNIHWLNSGEVANFPVETSELTITEKGMKESSTSFVPKGSVILSITRHLRVSILDIDSCINQSIVGIIPSNEIKREYLYFSLKSEIPRLMTLRTGAQQPHINKETVEDTLLLLPTKDLLIDFQSRVEPIFSKIMNSAREIERLTFLRDYLLPLLMNGQVTIKE